LFIVAILVKDTKKRRSVKTCFVIGLEVSRFGLGRRLLGMRMGKAVNTIQICIFFSEHCDKKARRKAAAKIFFAAVMCLLPANI
jgi:hypothetical protein